MPISFQILRSSNPEILKFHLILYCGFLDEHDWNVILNRIHTFARRALESGAVFHENDRRMTARTHEDFKQFRVQGHALEYMSHAKVLWNNLPMKLIVPLVVTAAFLGGAVAADAQQSRPGSKPAAPAKVDPVAQAYDQFLLAHRLKDEDDADGAMAAYKRAMALDPKSATIVAELADLHMR